MHTEFIHYLPKTCIQGLDLVNVWRGTCASNFSNVFEKIQTQILYLVLTKYPNIKL